MKKPKPNVVFKANLDKEQFEKFAEFLAWFKKDAEAKLNKKSCQLKRNSSTCTRHLNCELCAMYTIPKPIVEKKKTPQVIFKEHLGEVRKTLRENQELYNTYQANIAVQFQDVCFKAGIRFPQLHEISNIAADNFLKLWIKD